MSRLSLLRILVAALFCLSGILHAASPSDTLQQANKSYNDHSYQQAAQKYQELLKLDPLPADIDLDQVKFRLADATWHNLASTRQPDNQALDASREQLTELAAQLQKAAKGARPPQLWADIQDSLGDSYWQPDQFRNWNEAWPHYQKALDWWAASTSIDKAREHYLDIIFRASMPTQTRSRWQYGYTYNNWMPEEVLQDAVSIAQTPANIAHANYLLAMSLMRTYNATALKAGPAFEAAIRETGTEWADDALYQYAQWAQRMGASYWDEYGNFRSKGDDALALKLYRQFLERYQEGDSRYWTQATFQVDNITAQSIQVNVSNSFLPKSTVEFSINWRNIEQVSIGVYAIDLAENFQPEPDERNASPFNHQGYDLSEKTPVARLSRTSNDEAYAQQQDVISLEDGLPAGAYVIQAEGDGVVQQALLLITTQMLTVLRDSETTLVWVTDAQSGQPLSEASVKVWLGHQERKQNEYVITWIQQTKATDADGIARFTAADFSDLKFSFQQYTMMTALASHEGQPSAAVSSRYAGPYGYETNPDNASAWKIYAFTDRPAYRPGETIHWKTIARLRESAANWKVPSADSPVKYRIYGPQGDQITEGTLTFNEYGSMWGELTAEPDWKLGMYRIEFRLGKNNNHIGNEEFFRLEEYKLPEYKVSVQAASADGETATAYRLGDEVKVEIMADYYFGGAVTNAEVNVIVRESPYYHYWQPPTPYPWMRQATQPRHHNYGEVVVNEQLKTDAEGRATLTIPTKASSRYDLQYSIEARVVDESRREVSGQATIRATRNPYFIYLQPERTLYRPGETATITVKALNANDDPVQVEGRIRLTREEWMQVWRGPDGEEISGQEYNRRLKKSAGLFTSALDPNDWTMIRQGYDVEEIKTVTLTTSTEGEAKLTFPIEKTGYYRAYWVSKPERSAPIKAETAIWAADSASQSIGYQGSLQIVADEDAFREGQRAPVMLTTPESGYWVLFSVQGANLISTQVVYLEGNVKLLQLDVNEQWIPNVRLQANANKTLRNHQDIQDINVPPDKHFLDVSLVTNAETYLPREKATAMITTRDVNGRPVSAEVALSVFDEAVLAIQSTLAPDPREFFYGEQRPYLVNTVTSLNMQSFRVIEKLADVSAQWQRKAGNKLVMDEFSELGTVSADHFAAPTVTTAVPKMVAQSSMLMAHSRMEKKADDKANLNGVAAEPNVIVRNDFRSTVLWKPAIQTDANGQASVEFEMPDNLTTWNLEARAVGLPASFGTAEAQTKTRLPLIARLQTPRFLVTGDQLTITGVINNNTDDAISVQTDLKIEGGLTITDSASQSIDIPAQGSTQVNWSVDVKTPGDAKLILTAKSSSHGDAMELTIPVYEHGIDKFLARGGKMTTDSLDITLDIPKFKPEGATFALHLSPSIATTMLDALPYLAQYPYGCTEQTLSRFLPATIVAKTLNDLGVSTETVMQQNFGGIDPNTPAKIINQNKPRKDGDLTNLPGMVADGLARLTDLQHSDGGWGWWKNDSSDPFMSAYAVWGLTLAKQAGENVDTKMLERGRNYLALQLVNFENRLNMQAWLLHALAANNRGHAEAKPDKYEAKAFANLWKNRDQLESYGRALTALSAHWLGFADEALILADNLANGVKLDNNPQGSVLLPGNPDPQADATILRTAHWGEDGIYYRWSRGGVEATAFVLAALVEIKPDSELIEPTMNWLVKNRRGAQWNNTRDTAIVVLALNNWLRQSGELQASGQYTALLNGKSIGVINVSPDTVLTAPRVIDVPVSQLKVGANKLTLQRKAGTSPLYFATRFNFFSLEDPITAAGNELFVKRAYERTFPVKTLLNGYDTQSAQLLSGGQADTGDRIEAIITIESKNNLEYIMIEDLKPAGFEAVALQSGASLYARELRPTALDQEDRYTGRTQWVYQELRDRQIASFISTLPQGLWEIRYELRAETPGTFSALPVIGEAMYVPEIKGNSAEFKVTVEDK